MLSIPWSYLPPFNRDTVGQTPTSNKSILDIIFGTNWFTTGWPKLHRILKEKNRIFDVKKIWCPSSRKMVNFHKIAKNFVVAICLKWKVVPHLIIWIIRLSTPHVRRKGKIADANITGYNFGPVVHFSWRTWVYSRFSGAHNPLGSRTRSYDYDFCSFRQLRFFNAKNHLGNNLRMKWKC